MGSSSLMVAGAVILTWGLIDPYGIVGDPYSPDVLGPGPENTAIHWLNAVAFVVTIIAALDAVRRTAQGSLPRRRGVAYLRAFAVFDLGNLAQNFGSQFPDAWHVYAVGSVVITIGTLLIARALLWDQILDIDIKIKWTLKRGTLVGMVLALFLVATAVAEQYLQGYGFVVGGGAIGLLLFALRPIERAIDRLADRAMPKTTGTPEYLAQRKHEIYRAAIEDMAADGAITVKERSALLRLAKNLGLDGNDAMRIESEVLGAGDAV
jgi:hypothetical protein